MKIYKDNNKVLSGYDNNGLVFDSGSSIIRKIRPAYIDVVKELYSLYHNTSLDKLGIVDTQFDYKSKLLEHKKYPISYPYEWTANMFKDAVLFHLNLFLELDRYGLTLKDAVPSNILFNFNKLVFVDFLSLVKKENLKNEAWLVAKNKYDDPRFAVVDIMLIPYIIIPFLIMYMKNYSSARRILFEKACNSPCGVSSWEDVIPLSNLSLSKRIKYKIGFNIYKIIDLIFKKTNKNSKFHIFAFQKKLYKNFKNGSYQILIKEIYNFINKCDVTPEPSAYVTYYDEKKEDFNFTNQDGWKNKQKNIFKLLNDIKPKQVLDIGTNTGWFSRLAESLGAQVISTDIDESSIDRLYIAAKKNNLKILPLLISFQDLKKELYGIIDNDPIYKDRDFKNNPLFLPATERFKSDIVFCLGLLHHLVLGSGESLESIFSILGELTLNTLVLEFTGLDDHVIIDEPSFFKNINKYSNDNYNIDVIKKAGKKYFSSVVIMDSHPETRKLLIFTK